MIEERPNPDSNRDANTDTGSAPAPNAAGRDWEATGARVGGALGRFARRALSAGEQAARDARPEAERLAQKARAAAEAARPHVERVGRDAVRYARDHEDELKRAARVGAEFTARNAIPLPLRPVVDAIEAERLIRPAPLRDDRPAELRRSLPTEDDAEPKDTL